MPCGVPQAQLSAHACPVLHAKSKTFNTCMLCLTCHKDNCMHMYGLRIQHHLDTHCISWIMCHKQWRHMPAQCQHNCQYMHALCLVYKHKCIHMYALCKAQLYAGWEDMMQTHTCGCRCNSCRPACPFQPATGRPTQSGQW